MSTCVLFATVLVVGALATEMKRQSNSWDFLLYVERWPGTITQSRLPKNVTSFVLHGMWPERNDASWPSNCPGSAFDASKLNQIYGEMLEYWPNLQPSSSILDFWKHEWVKHGTCGADGTTTFIRDQLSFFKFALKIHSQMPYRDQLAYYGITASTTQTYTLAQVNSALAQAFNFTVIPSCQNNNGQYDLMRLYSCIDKSGTLIACPSAVVTDLTSKQACGNGQSIGVPPIQH